MFYAIFDGHRSLEPLTNLAPHRGLPVRLWRNVRTIFQQSNEYIDIPNLK